MTNRLELQAARQCANYDGGMCFPCDKPCELKQEGQTCRYFTEQVQKPNPALRAQYERGEADNLKQCLRCGKPFSATGRRQQYCPVCGVRLQKERTAERVRRHRNTTQK